MKIAAYTDDRVFDTLQPEWNVLVHRSATDTIFCTWEWQSTWWRTYQPGTLWVVTCRDDANQLIGIGSWFIHEIDGERIVRTIGCVDVTDYLDIIADTDQVQAVQEGLAAFLYDHADAYDRVNFCNIPEASPTYATFLPQLQGRGFAAEWVVQEVCPVIHLPNDWELYLESLDKKQRHEIRRKIRRAESEAALEYVVVDASHDFDAMLEQFIALMRASHPQKAKFLDDEKNTNFFRRVMPLINERGWLKLNFLMIDGVASAAYCDFDYNGQILVYNSGLLPDENAHLSPGIVLLSYNIRQAIETGHTLFDFLRGNETYKYRMGAQDTSVYKLLARLGGSLTPEPDEAAADPA